MLSLMTPNELQKHRSLRAAAIKKTRVAKGWSKKELSDKTGITRRTIDSIENETSFWGIAVEIIILHELGMACFQPVYREEGGRMVIVEMVLMPKKV